VTNTPSFTTMGNNAVTAGTWFTPQPQGLGTPGPDQRRPVDADRTYGYDDLTLSSSPETFENVWNESGCDPVNFTPASLQQNDVMAAIINLFAAHNRHHDWTYRLGFTEQNFNAQVRNFGMGGLENDPEIGDAQAGAAIPVASTVAGRNNANQFILPDGVPGITNQYLWQPIPGAYPPCADGNFDQIIVGHEYGHLVHNRMAAGPMNGINGTAHGGALTESWGDQSALEYVNEYGFVPVQSENPWAMAVFATGDHESAIRNYPMNGNPLQFGDLEYDPYNPSTTGHSNSEVWTAVNWDVRQALVNKYNGTFPSGNLTLQRECADRVRPPELCPGNRRWIQLQYDSFLLIATAAPSLLDTRDALLAADVNRHLQPTADPWPLNQVELWGAFASDGYGCSAYNSSGNDLQPVPAYDRPTGLANTLPAPPNPPNQASDCNNTNDRAMNFIVRDAALAPITNAKVFIGNYEARVSPIADSDPGTMNAGPSTANLDSAARFAPGVYQAYVQAPGYGHRRFALTVNPGPGSSNWEIGMDLNVASRANGADASAAFPAAPTPATDEDNLIDDTEETQWDTGTLPANVNDPLLGQPDVIIDLAGTQPRIARLVNISAVAEAGRTSSLRRFRIEVCNDGGVPGACAIPTALNYTQIFQSNANPAATPCPVSTPAGAQVFCNETHLAFPAQSFRPVAPNQLLRSFDISPANEQLQAGLGGVTHLRMIALDNQCTGEPRYAGDQENDPTTPTTDCATSAATRNVLRMSEIEVFEFDPGTIGAFDPAVAFVKTGPATAARGSTITYTLRYANAGPAPSSTPKITDVLPTGLSFVSASNGGTYNAATRTVTWNLNTVPVGESAVVTLTARINPDVAIGTAIINKATFTAPLTVATPAAAVTVAT
jgi:uncharacterized repeat protein (TIGR01451 family)